MDFKGSDESRNVQQGAGIEDTPNSRLLNVTFHQEQKRGIESGLPSKLSSFCHVAFLLGKQGLELCSPHSARLGGWEGVEEGSWRFSAPPLQPPPLHTNTPSSAQPSAGRFHHSVLFPTPP